MRKPSLVSSDFPANEAPPREANNSDRPFSPLLNGRISLFPAFFFESPNSSVSFSPTVKETQQGFYATSERMFGPSLPCSWTFRGRRRSLRLFLFEFFYGLNFPLDTLFPLGASSRRTRFSPTPRWPFAPPPAPLANSYIFLRITG